jgi:glycosyltransferase involved in cell wall biosynthesis
MISRIDENKGVREFVQAADLVQRHMKNTAFLLVGPYASEGKQAEQFVEQLRHQSETVHYLGPRKDIPAILSLSDICALPSYREGLPRVLVEAGALQVPCITTDVPGCRDVILDDWNGRLVPPRNTQALADAMIELLSDQTRRTEMGQRSYQYVKEKFDLSSVADAYAKIYLRALADGR